MEEKIGDLINRHLTTDDNQARLAATFVGQAHIACTGPEGATCRECTYWGSLNKKGDVVPPKHHPNDMTGDARRLKNSGCHYPICNKPKKRFPPEAGACRFFDRNPEPPVLVKPEPPPKEKKAPKADKPKRKRKVRRG